MKLIKQLFIIAAAGFLISCNSGTSGNSLGSGPNFKSSNRLSNNAAESIPDGPTSLGELPNGSQILISQADYVEPETGQYNTNIFLTTAESTQIGTTYNVTFSTTPMAVSKASIAKFNDSPLPKVSADGSCVISGNQNCDVILDSNNAPLGTYEITPIFTNTVTGAVTNGGAFTYNVVDGGSHPKPDDGKLVIMVNGTSVESGGTVYGFVGLTDSRNVESVTVSIASLFPSESGVASVTPQTCVVSSKTGCPIAIRGLKQGAISFVATAVKCQFPYQVAMTPRIIVAGTSAPGFLDLKVSPQSLNYGSEAIATVSLLNAQNVRNLTVSFISDDPSIMDVESSSCVIINSSAGSNSCQIKIHGESAAGYASVIAYIQDGSYTPAGQVVGVHPNPVSGTLAVSLANPAINFGQTTTAQIQLKNSQYVSDFVVTTSSSDTSVATINTPNTCILSSNNPSCTIAITASSSESGFTNIKAEAESYAPAQSTLQVYPTPIPGSLSVSLSNSTLPTDTDTVATVTLNASMYVQDVAVTVDSDDYDIAAPILPNVCHVSSANNTCQVQVHSNKIGNANIFTTASGYTSNSTPITVVNLGVLSINPSVENLVYGESSNITLSINGSVNVQHAKVTLLSSESTIATVTDCVPNELSTLANTCNATITAGQITNATTVIARVNVDGYNYPESTVIVNVTPSQLPGTLSVSPLTLNKDTTGTQVITLNGSRLITTPITVNIVSQNPSIANPSTNSCHLSTESPTCPINVKGVNVGSTLMFASSAGYTTANGSVQVNPAAPIPQQCSLSQSGTFNTTDPFSAIKISYTFEPSQLSKDPDVQFYPSNGVFNLNYRTDLSPGQQVYTDASSTNPVTIGNVTQLLEPGSSTSGSGTEHASCGGGWTSSTASLTPSPDGVLQNKIHLTMDNNSTGDCGGQWPQHYEDDIPIDGSYSKNVYTKDSQGCGGGNWDMWGNVTVNNAGCAGDQCAYIVSVNAGHNGTPGQPYCNDTMTYNLTYKRPTLYTQLSDFSNFNQQTSSPNYIGGLGSQNLSASMSGNNVNVSPVITCNASGWCTSTNPNNVWYTYDWSSLNTTMSYSISQPNQFGNVCVDFDPS